MKKIILILYMICFCSFAAEFIETSREVTVTTDIAIYTIQKYGGTISSIVLTQKKFHEIQDDTKTKKELLLFHTENPTGGILVNAINDTFIDTLYKITCTEHEREITVKCEPLNYPDGCPSEIRITREFIFKDGEYPVGWKITYFNSSAAKSIIKTKISISPGIHYNAKEQSAFFIGADSKKKSYNVSEKPVSEIFSGEISLFGFKNIKNYTIFIKNDVPAAEYQYENVPGGQNNGNARMTVSKTATVTVGFENIVSVQGLIYAGPQDMQMLEKIQSEAVIDMGFFGAISRILIMILHIFYKFTGSWGVAIILLTVFIKLILYPLTLKQNKSMIEMQKIQPMMNQIREKYKNDAQRMNTEMMNLYREHNVNPLGGCLPVLIQLPILFALFTALRISIELKAEPFLLILPKFNFWIPDLAEADKTWILPVLIAYVMHLQNKKITDPQQKKMMAFMPIMMLFLSSNLPAGVLIYWFVSSLLGIWQQWFDSNVLGIKPPQAEQKPGKKHKKHPAKN